MIKALRFAISPKKNPFPFNDIACIYHKNMSKPAQKMLCNQAVQSNI